MKRVLTMSALVAGVVSALLAQWNATVAGAFAGSALWAIASLYVWGRLIPVVCVPPSGVDTPGRRLKVLVLALAKFALFASGVAALYVFAPETRAQVFAVIGGVSTPFVVMFLKAVGAQMTNRDILEDARGGSAAAAESAPEGEG